MPWLQLGEICSVPEPSYVIFVRHGDYHQRPGAPSARQPFALTERGHAQAMVCAADVAELRETYGLSLAPVLYSSLQLRAWQTAEEIRKGVSGLESILETSALGERSLGCAANLTVDEIQQVLRNDPRHDPPPVGWKSDSDYRLPLEGAESLSDAGRRVAAHLKETLVPGRAVLHVGHGASFRHACHVLGVLKKPEIARLSIFHAKPLLLCYKGHDTWTHMAGEWKVRARSEDPID